MLAMLWLVGGVGLGWGLSQLFDPTRGRRRRARIRDKAIRSANTLGDALDTTSRDVRNRTRGVIAQLRRRRPDDRLTDIALVERVRSRLGGVVRHPRALEVFARDGRVMLCGPILADEVDDLIAEVSAVRGVREIENHLEVHAEPGDVPGLQGGGRRRRRGRRFEFMQRHWSPAARLIAGLTGAGLTLAGLKHRGVVGRAIGAAGLALLGRAVTNLPLKRLFGVGAGRWAVTVQKTITVAAPIEQVFEFWSHYENFPCFMAHVREVRRLADGRARWTVAGPAGVPIEWETEETRCEPPELLAWKTIEGSPVAHAGVVRFDQYPEGTRIHLRMHYNPPAGAVGHALALVLGADPKRALDEDLVRFKSLLEDGQTSVRGRTVTREALA